MEILLAVGLGAVLTIITAVGDYFVKSAAEDPWLSGWKKLILGAIIWGVTAFGWFFLMKKYKLSTIGVLYAVGMVILLTLLSVFYFKEKISPMEIVGIVMAIASLFILFRFS